MSRPRVGRSHRRPAETPSGSGAPADPAAALFDVAPAHMPHGLCMFDENKRLILCNSAYAQLYDLPARLTASGTPLSEILDYRERRGNGPLDIAT